MNPVALYFASGESLYPGALLLMLVALISLRLRRAWALRMKNVTAWLAFVMIVMACPPFPWFIDAVFLIVFALWFWASDIVVVRPRWLRARQAATIALVTLLFALPAVELSHRAIPVIAGIPSDHLVVIGDSISSGIDPHVPAWPEVLQQTTSTHVKNLSRPGAKTSEGLVMTESITQEDSVVLIEIGGNDLLSGVPSSEFGRALEALLSKVSAPGRTVVMFELPLLPNKIAYGQIQRRLATKHGVFLIPKRFFVNVIGGANATSDGLHLSEAGAGHMAALVGQVLSHVLRPPATTGSPRVTLRLCPCYPLAA
jgi:acyl-CoA thioesterase-1